MCVIITGTTEPSPTSPPPTPVMWHFNHPIESPRKCEIFNKCGNTWVLVIGQFEPFPHNHRNDFAVPFLFIALASQCNTEGCYSNCIYICIIYHVFIFGSAQRKKRVDLKGPPWPANLRNADLYVCVFICILTCSMCLSLSLHWEKKRVDLKEGTTPGRLIRCWRALRLSAGHHKLSKLSPPGLEFK